MSREVTFERIERARSFPENTGTRLENEFLGNVDATKYKELAYKFLHPETDEKVANPKEKFEKILKIREAAQEEFESTLDLADENKYIDFKNSMKLVEKCQIGNPEKPNQLFSRALYNSVKDRFEDKYTLKFFTAVGGTHLDFVHGVDCFFKLYDKKSGQELAIATIDLTKRAGKDQAKADVTFNINGEEQKKYDPSSNNKSFDKNFFNGKITEFSGEIKETLINNYNIKNHRN